MNYRHAFHAGNFADVVKHAVLAQVLTYLHDKAAAFRVIDTHAGAGLYDLRGEEASRGGEWQGGIGRLYDGMLPEPLATFLAPYLTIVRAHNHDAALTTYPGSPLIVRALLRPQDRLVACELEPRAQAALLRTLHGDTQARVVAIDGWTALNAYVPPNERRGVVLIDPPFERPDEFLRMRDGFLAAYAKWPTGIYLMWYPVKDRAAVQQFVAALGTVTDKWLRIELDVGTDEASGLRRTGLIAVNPPWTLAKSVTASLPQLRDCLARGADAAVLIQSADAG